MLKIFSSLLFALSLLTVLPAHAADSPRVVDISITADGRFVPENITVKQGENIVLRVTAHQSKEIMIPVDIIHDFHLMYNQMVILKHVFKVENGKSESTAEISWTPLVQEELTMRCHSHSHSFGRIKVIQ